MGTTILLVEDNEELNMLNRRALELAGYHVLAALTLAEARAHLAQNRFEVILLDVMLPDGDGVAFCREIRNATDAHILFLTSKREDEDHLRGLGAGGDDYITKPYRMDVMLARVDAALRRRGMQAHPPAGLLQAGPLALDTVALQAFLDGEDMLLSPKEFALLLALVQNAGRVLSKESLYEAVWKQPLAGDGGALRTRLSRLNKKLGESEAVVLSGVRGEGYLLEILG